MKLITNTSPSLVPNDFSVGYDVVAHVTSAGVLSDTYRGKQCELFTKKGGITSNFVLFGFKPERTFILRVNAEEGVSEQAMEACLQLPVLIHLTSTANLRIALQF